MFMQTRSLATGRRQRFGLTWILLAAGLTCACRAADLQLGWTNNILSISGPDVPGKKVEVWYLEAFCRHGSTKQSWDKTTIPHRTELVSADQRGQKLKLRTHVDPAVELQHEIRVVEDGVEFQVSIKNTGPEFADVQWFQPCVRVDRFTGLKQSDYIARCFIFTQAGLTTLDKTHRSDEAIYHGGQVYVPAGINHDDVNPRPISPDVPVNGLIGCFSADGKFLLASAWDQTQELFQGVIVCVHNDPRVGGLRPAETKQLRGRIYLLKNNPADLLTRYERDFGKATAPKP